MHPTYTSDRPGQCPICGMNLVPIKEGETNLSTIQGRASITADTERRQLIGLRLGTAEKKLFTKEIRAVGRVELNERLLSSVNLKFAGWIERLHVSAVGDVVSKGQPLFEIYSPELLEAEKNYLLAFEARRQVKDALTPEASSFAERNLRSARERLLLWDLCEEQIKSLETAKEPQTRVPIRSKVQGVVTKRTAQVGGYVQPGTDLYEIADLSALWIRVEVYEYELPDLKLGLAAEVRLSSRPGETLTGKVAYIYPTMNEQTRTASLRLEVPNPDGKLKPGMYANVFLRTDLGEQIVVDDQAVLDTGTRQIVFLEAGEGRLVPQEVVVGSRSDGQAVILKGLSGGERIVVSGNFLVDSESRLKAALQQGPQPGGHKH
jgi:RND family efflux transporter MFP subunit